MKRSHFQRIVIGSALALASFGANAVVFFNGLHDIEILNRENVYRSTATCAESGGCLAFDPANDPVGFQRADPTIANNILPGDIFAGVFATREVTHVASGVTTWSADNVAAGGIDTFTGYFAQAVAAVQLNAIGALDRIILGTTPVDPFGVLGAGEVARIWVDTGAGTPFVGDGLLTTTFSSIASATDGSLWAAFGVGATNAPVDNDGYTYSEAEIGGGLANFGTGTFYSAWDILLQGPAFNIAGVNPINDPTEGIFGGLQAGDPLLTAFQNLFGVCFPGAGTYACNDIVGNGQLSVNQNVSPWQFASEDPLQINVVPEPGTLALLGAMLVGAGFARRRIAR